MNTTKPKPKSKTGDAAFMELTRKMYGLDRAVQKLPHEHKMTFYVVQQARLYQLFARAAHDAWGMKPIAAIKYLDEAAIGALKARLIKIKKAKKQKKVK